MDSSFPSIFSAIPFMYSSKLSEKHEMITLGIKIAHWPCHYPDLRSLTKVKATYITNLKS